MRNAAASASAAEAQRLFINAAVDQLRQLGPAAWRPSGETSEPFLFLDHHVEHVIGKTGDEGMMLPRSRDLFDRIAGSFGNELLRARRIALRRSGRVDRTSVVSGKSGSVRVALGGLRNIKKKNKTT